MERLPRYRDDGRGFAFTIGKKNMEGEDWKACLKIVFWKKAPEICLAGSKSAHQKGMALSRPIGWPRSDVCSAELPSLASLRCCW